MDGSAAQAVPDAVALLKTTVPEAAEVEVAELETLVLGPSPVKKARPTLLFELVGWIELFK